MRYEELQSPSLGADEVRIEVMAAGVNFPDSLKAAGTHQVRPPLPWVPGSETGGVVLEVGAVVTGLRVGDRVLGVSTKLGGGYAQEIVLPTQRVFVLPDGVSFETAAALPIAYGTSLHALTQRARLQVGETLLVLGAAGGVGLAAVELGRVLGARVIAAASTPEKRALATDHGASDVVDYTQPDWRHEVRKLTGGSGVDVVYDPVGGDAFDEAVHAIGWMGRYLVVGFTAGRIPTLRLNLPLVKGYDVVGVRYDVWCERSWVDARANLEQVVRWCDRGQVRPVVSATYPLEQAAVAMQAVTRRQTTGKVVLTTTLAGSAAGRSSGCS